ncbi:MAG: winged helix-turn-helix transcriptional regulator [Janthinobacterium lividum]
MSSLDIDDDTDSGGGVAQALADLARARRVLDKIADKWTVLILTVLCPKPSRFNQIKRRLGGITHKALADALKRLERNGLVTRTVLPTQPVGVEYAITPLGSSLRQPFEQLCGWALVHGGELDDAQRAYDRAKDAI